MEDGKVLKTNEELAREYLDLISREYMHLKAKMRKFCEEKDYKWDEDLFSDTYLKVYEKILKNGIMDKSEQGFLDYTFIAFKLNTKREQMYKRVTSRDYNVCDEEIPSLYEEYFNDNNDSSTVKLISDLWKDFCAKEIIESVEKEFGSEKARLFASKYMVKGNTYKKLAEKTHIKGLRNEIITIKNWVRDNITKEMLKEKFSKEYDDILPF